LVKSKEGGEMDLGFVGKIAGTVFGGPVGGAIGGAVGSALGGGGNQALQQQFDQVMGTAITQTYMQGTQMSMRMMKEAENEMKEG
jgi:hypothetical protein